MVANESPQPARMIAGRYRLGSRLGSSFQAAVFDAFDEQLQRSVVLKLVHPDLSDLPELQESFQQTLAIAGGLHHPNIAAVYDWGRARWNDREVLYVTTERLVGGSLRDLLDRGRLLSPSQALLVGLDACKALDAMHREGLVHTDIRPSTLVFGDDRRLRVVDAGLAQVLHLTAGDVTARSVDRAKYSSPEEAQGQPVQPKSDVYSLCLSLLEAVTGSVPFEAESAVATLANRVDRLMPVSADFGQLAAVFERAGRPDVSTRYTAAEFGRALVQSAEKMPRPAPLPILTNSLFAPDSGGADQPVEPTGPLARPPVLPPEEPTVAESVVAEPVVASDVEEPVVEEPVVEEPVVEEPVVEEPVVEEPVVEAPLVIEAAAEPLVVLPPPARVVPAPLPPPLPTVEPALQPTIEPAVEPTVQMPLVVRTDLEPTAAQVVVPAIALADDEEFDPADEFPDRPPSVPGGRRWFLALLVLLAIGGGVLAWYNTRPETSPVPALAGMRQGEALNQLGPFKGAIGEEASETVEAGVVVRTEPVEGTVLEHGKTVTIFVSTGPAPRVLPELAGLTIDAAKATLIDMGLVPIEADAVFSEEVPPGVVVSWSVPAAPTLVAGATVTKGTTVQIVASSGPAPRVVPDLTNMPAADATAAVTGLQLLYAQAPDEFSNTVPAGAVIRQDLPPGSEAAKGATVTVVLSKGPDLVAMPPLAGLDYNAIRAAIEAAGLTVGTITGDTAQPFQSASVSGSAVADGQQFLRGTAVDLTFAPTPVVTTVP